MADRMAIATGSKRTSADDARRPPRARRLAAAQGADDRRRGEDPRARSSRTSRSRRSATSRTRSCSTPRRTPGRLPPLQPGRRRAPARDPADAARRVPAPAGDPPGARHRATSPGRRPSGESQKRRAASVGETVTTFYRARTLLERGRRRRPVPARAAGVRRRPARAPRRARRLRRDGPRDRPRCLRAVEVRRRRAQPARLPAPRPTARRRCSSSCSAPSLRSRSQARRKEAVENLESLAAVCGAPQASAARPRPAAPQGHRRVEPGPTPMPQVTRSRVIAAPIRSESGTWSPTRTTCRAGGRR